MTLGSTVMPGPQKEQACDNWWDGFYDEAVAELFLVRQDRAELEATLAFLRRELGLSGDGHVFDQCCGIGSVSIPLAAGGLRVSGVDLSPAYVNRARADAAPLGDRATFACSDAFRYLPETPCEAAFNWYSSFGYSGDDARNREMLARAYESLKPGGRFALDIPALYGVARNFKDCMLRRGTYEGREVLLVRESRMDLEGGFLRQRWTWFLGGRQMERHSAVRLYPPHQIIEMLRAVGFAGVRLLGGIDGQPFTMDSMRCIAIAERA